MNELDFIPLILDTDFVDRFEKDPDIAVDVFIPLLNSNPFFERNLTNFYKRIPINRLLIGDGGCDDDSIEIVNKFPRVTVFDHSSYKSQGYSIKNLIEACKTDFCIYLHADVMLPEKWFETMYSHRHEHNWFECDRTYVAVVTWDGKKQMSKERAYSGSQFGNTKKLQHVISAIEDDYLQRNEDIIIAELMDMSDYERYEDTFHFHQMVSKPGTKEPEMIITPSIKRTKKKEDIEWEKRIYEMQWKGIVKYCKPKPYLIKSVKAAIKILKKHGVFDEIEAKKWVEEVNDEWNSHLFRKLWR